MPSRPCIFGFAPECVLLVCLVVGLAGCSPGRTDAGSRGGRAALYPSLKISLGALDRVVLRYKESLSERLTLHFREGRVRAEQGSCVVDLSAGRSIGGGLKELFVSVDPPFAGESLVIVRGRRAGEGLYIIGPGRHLSTLLAPVKAIEGSVLADLATRVRAQPFTPGRGGKAAAARDRARKILRRLLDDAGLSRPRRALLSRWLPKLLHQRLPVDAPLIERLRPLRILEAAYAEAGWPGPPWEAVSARLGLRLQDPNAKNTDGRTGLEGMTLVAHAPALGDPTNYIDIDVALPKRRTWPPQLAVVAIRLRPAKEDFALTVGAGRSLNVYRAGYHPSQLAKAPSPSPYFDLIVRVSPPGIRRGRNRIRAAYLENRGGPITVSAALWAAWR